MCCIYTYNTHIHVYLQHKLQSIYVYFIFDYLYTFWLFLIFYTTSTWCLQCSIDAPAGLEEWKNLSATNQTSKHRTWTNIQKRLPEVWKTNLMVLDSRCVFFKSESASELAVDVAWAVYLLKGLCSSGRLTSRWSTRILVFLLFPRLCSREDRGRKRGKLIDSHQRGAVFLMINAYSQPDTQKSCYTAIRVQIDIAFRLSLWLLHIEFGAYIYICYLYNIKYWRQFSWLFVSFVFVLYFHLFPWILWYSFWGTWGQRFCNQTADSWYVGIRLRPALKLMIYFKIL